MSLRIEQLAREVLAGRQLGAAEATALVGASADRPADLLYWAHRIRRERFGDEVKFCSIGAGRMGACSEDCKWCAQSARYATHVPSAAQRASAEQLTEAAEQAVASGASSFGIVNSGRTPGREDLDLVARAVPAIHAATGRHLTACASLGELDDRTAARLVAMGVRRYNHNLETSRRLYGRLVTTHRYDDRLATLAAARRAGLSLCCGGIFGVGETWDDRIDLALTLRDQVRPDVTPLNFLHPIPGTPLQEVQPLSPAECLRIIAVFRFLLPQVDLKVAGGREVNLRDLQSWMFYAGATSCLVGNYLTTAGRQGQDDLQMVADLGLKLVETFSCEHTASTCTAGRAD